MASTQENAKQDLRPLKEPSLHEEPQDFSLVLGGPVFQLFRKPHLSGETLEFLHRRIIVLPLIAWLPLVLLASLGATSGGACWVCFFRDVEVQVRFLIALPVLIAAELIVHRRLRPVVHRFIERRIVLPDDLARFDGAIQRAISTRNSVAVEIALIVLVYSLGLWLWASRVPIGSATWYATPGGRWHLTPAGYWYVFISIPIVQFVLLRWYLRFFIWYRFLWQVSRLNLHLIATHPDRCAGLAFLGKSAFAFGPILFAQGAMLAGVIASRVLYRGESLLSFKLQIGGFIAFVVLAVLVPLVMFTPRMADAKRKGLADYGQLAQDYVEGFEQKWVIRNPAAADDLVGSADIQSLADLSSSYEIVTSIRPVPFGLQDVTRLAAATAAPFLPLLLTVLSPEELIMRLIKIMF